MKKSALTIALLSSLALGAYADSQTFYGGATSGARSLVSGTTIATDVTLDSIDGRHYKADGITVHTLNFINGDVSIANTQGWKAEKGITIDINSDAESVDALTGSGRWQQNLFSLTFANTGGGAKANVNVGVFEFTANAASGQNTFVNFNTDTVVTTTSTSSFGVNSKTSAAPNRMYFNVASGKSVEWNGNINVQSSAVMNIAGTFTHKGAMSFSGDEISTLNITGELIFDYTLGQTINTSFNLGGRISQTSASGDNGITLNRTSTINAGGYLQAHSKLVLNTNSSLTVESGGTVELSKDSSNVARVLLSNGSTLTLNSANCIITSGSAESAKLATFAGANASLYVNADQTFSTLYSNAGIFSVYLGDGATITMESPTGTLAGSGTYRIFNFQEDSFFVGTNASVKSYIETNVTLYDGEEQLLGAATVSDLGFIALAAIPEPATWAAILGCVALGFAAYRRRK
jgi:hypothetical protein